MTFLEQLSTKKEFTEFCWFYLFFSRNLIMNITFCEEEKEEIQRKHPSAVLVSVEWEKGISLTIIRKGILMYRCNLCFPILSLLNLKKMLLLKRVFSYDIKLSKIRMKVWRSLKVTACLTCKVVAEKKMYSHAFIHQKEI